jgi:HK97 family phage prohead protease
MTAGSTVCTVTQVIVREPKKGDEDAPGLSRAQAYRICSTDVARAKKPRLERHSLKLKVRAQGRQLAGYAAVFNSDAAIGDFVESIAPGAFRASLGNDIVALVDHDAGKELARTRSRTLRLAEKGKGLLFSLDVPQTTFGADILALAERGDVGSMSFGFNVAKAARGGTATGAP